ncbi:MULTISPECIES: DUF3105 domain-containing protein [Micrococcaceae]|jgi:type IV secretory pathway VirB10-like protein|uniref:Type IV secretory pathway VirB10-like protein n=1 Tax=Pseudarthrobacter enclensis TaxID=993070 RepID=A0ABT9RYQ0_9MICC|nr:MULTISPECIES: DUF3105 domain-containing protein [Micrococcaceae]MDP9890372.1 type IV secretory pathway VirB10-like protein [Pseudarthrobacter enclensis]UKA73470.1 DUF3105 domain-containing protein [Arthrobacter sp. FW306-06-A]WJH26692.1 DUF3105 domain-containing protein [Pseudarthrobacter defluvii]
MSQPRPSHEERQAILKALQAKQRAKARRKAWLLYGAAAAVVAAIIGSVAFVVVGEVRQREEATAAASRPIEGEQDFPDQSRNHTREPVSYPRIPATGGDHAPVWTNCGIYTAPVQQTQAVHSLEHGAVWLSYRPDLAADQIAELTAAAEGQQYLLLSPVPDQEAPIVATAWGKQLALQTSGDERLATFIKKYRQGPQTPEPGAVCTGGIQG